MTRHELTTALMMLDATHSALLDSEDAPVPRLHPYLTALVRASHSCDFAHDLADAVNDYRADNDTFHTLLKIVEDAMSDLAEEVL